MQRELIFQEIQRICIKHCVQDITKSELTIPQSTCLQRCSFKYKEAIEFGMNMFKLHEQHIKRSEQDAQKIKETQKEMAEKQEQYKKQFWELLQQKKSG